MLSFGVPFLLDQHLHFGLVPALHSKVEHFSCSRAENFREPSLLFTRASVDTTTKEKGTFYTVQAIVYKAAFVNPINPI